MSNMDNYFSASGLLVDRLKGKLTTVPNLNIRPAVSLDWVLKNPLSPSVNVIFLDDVADTSDGGRGRLGRSQLSFQHWLVLVSVSNVADAGMAAQNDIGRLLINVLTALQGWTPSAEHQPLYRQKSPYRKTDQGAFAHFPFVFSTGITITATAREFSGN